MADRDPRVDAYIAKAAPYAQPLLRWLRDAVHAASPGLQEDIKWGMPFFVHDGRPLANMAAFTAHCAFGFWKGREVADSGKQGQAMGQFGRIATPADLPGAREFKALVREAVQRSDAAAAAPAVKKPRIAKPLPAMPADFGAALAANAKALAHYEAMSPSHRREYLEWVLEAKQPATRAKRIAAAVVQLAQGQTRNAKYQC